MSKDGSLSKFKYFVTNMSCRYFFLMSFFFDVDIDACSGPSNVVLLSFLYLSALYCKEEGTGRSLFLMSCSHTSGNIL